MGVTIAATLVFPVFNKCAEREGTDSWPPAGKIVKPLFISKRESNSLIVLTSSSPSTIILHARLEFWSFSNLVDFIIFDK